MEMIGRSPKFLFLLGGRRALAMLGRSVALAERLCATCASVSPGERSPRLCLQKYNLSNASALIRRRATLRWHAP
jgi:hypothetical protein